MPMKIKEASEITGLTKQTIRFYESDTFPLSRFNGGESYETEKESQHDRR